MSCFFLGDWIRRGYMDRQIDGRYIGKYSIKYLGLILYIENMFLYFCIFLRLKSNKNNYNILSFLVLQMSIFS